MSTVKQLNQEHQANNVYHAKTKSELIKYLHQAAFSPVKATWKQVIENGQFATWPGLTVEAVEKYLPPYSPATDKGHMSRQRKGIRLTTKRIEDIFTQTRQDRKNKNSQRVAEWLNSKAAAEDMTPKQEENKMDEILCCTMQMDLKDGTTYMDCTGKFPVRSIDGMVTMFIIL